MWAEHSGEWTDAAKIESEMGAQSQMVCREMERDEEYELKAVDFTHKAVLSRKRKTHTHT